ncbi:MAG: succinyl-diaminopimelate desuccinylase [Gammaproteobacteria bacterium]|nr:succinyl-diaminopimelate desuccinylase [Gammaproteobacteria bacterium]TVQ43564.1 MAG: succinyl-diaminopimelate desuccinylase [Gammaproteobacteria bacterium]
MRTDSVDLTRELIRRPSVTPEDAGCQVLLGEHLERLGFRLEPLRFGDTDNLWARRGDSGPVLCFAGHTDVVPPGPLEQWSLDPFVPEIRDGQLYGRGAADMKASLAAMIGAVEDFLAVQPSPRGSIAFLITSDEEGPATDGTVRVMETLHARGETIDWCVVGEPSSHQALGDTVRVGRRGSLSGIITIHGVQGHVAYPQLVRNPIHDFARFTAWLAAHPLDEGNAFFPPTSFQTVWVEAGTGAPNVVPGTLRARFNFRYSTEWTHESLRQHIEALLAELGIDHELEWRLAGEPFLTREGPLTAAVQGAIRETLGVTTELSTGGGTSDGRFIAPYGVDVVELGPINASIHKIDEHVRVEDIDRLRRVYADILSRLLG